MSLLATEGTKLIESYLEALSGKPKPEEIIDRYVNDPSLKEHILQMEPAFPEYELTAHQLVEEGDTVAFRGVFHGIHKGVFAGIPPTGKHVSGDIMLFYRIHDGKIVEHWMVFDAASLMSQLRG
jgi:predicted ester cyclase